MVSWSMCNLSVFRGASPSVRQPSASGAPPRRNNQKFLSDSNQKSQIPLSNTTSQYHSPVIRKSPNTGFIPGNLKHCAAPLHFALQLGPLTVRERVKTSRTLQRFSAWPPRRVEASTAVNGRVNELRHPTCSTHAHP